MVLGPGLGALLIGVALLARSTPWRPSPSCRPLAVALFLPETRAERERRPRGRKLSFLDRRIMPLAMASVVMSVCQSATMQTATFFMMDLLEMAPQTAALRAGVALTVAASASLAVQVLVIRRFNLGPRVLLFWGCAIALAGDVLFLLSASYLLIVLALVCHGVGLGMLRPGLGAAASLAVGPGEQGAAAGLIMATGPVGHVLSPFVIMPLYQIFIFSPYILNAALMAGLLAYVVASPGIRAVLERARA